MASMVLSSSDNSLYLSCIKRLFCHMYQNRVCSICSANIPTRRIRLWGLSEGSAGLCGDIFRPILLLVECVQHLNPHDLFHWDMAERKRIISFFPLRQQPTDVCSSAIQTWIQMTKLNQTKPYFIFRFHWNPNRMDADWLPQVPISSTMPWKLMIFDPVASMSQPEMPKQDLPFHWPVHPAWIQITCTRKFDLLTCFGFLTAVHLVPWQHHANTGEVLGFWWPFVHCLGSKWCSSTWNAYLK